MDSIKTSFWSLTPLILFVTIFLVSALIFPQPISPLIACITAIAYALFTMNELPFNKRMQLFLYGSANNTVIAMCYIFILSAVFTYSLKLIGGIENAVSLGMNIIPTSYILPGFFITVSLFATAIGSSMGAIAAFIPVSNQLATILQVDPSLLAGIVVSGSMLGDNLSIISDTTIAATQTTQTSMKSKFKENIKLVIPAFFITLAILFWLNKEVGPVSHVPFQIPTASSVATVIPYFILFVTALFGIDVIAALVLGIFSAIIIGLANGTISWVQSSSIILDGFVYSGTGIPEVLILSLLISGLSYLVEYNGGIDYLLRKLSKRITSRRSAEFHIAILVFLVNAAVAINTIAILITGPLAKKIGDHFSIPGKRIASLLDVIACFCQGILPYAPQLLLAGSLAGISSIAIMPYLHYQWAIFLVTLTSIFYQPRKVLSS